MQPQGTVAWDTADEPTIEPPEPIERPVMLQRWDDLTFLHWPYAPETVIQLLPPACRSTRSTGRPGWGWCRSG